jgi:signal transduction histidine kinase
MRMAEVGVDALVAHAVSSVADLAKNKKQRVDVGPMCGALVHGNFTRLSQALINLLKNAVSYTAPGGSLSIDARMLGDEVEISVADTGRGIAPECLPHVFDRVYEQWGRNAQNPTGLGIGLGVVRRIAELHGGSVVARSNGLDSGSEFTVRLPSLAKAISSRKGGLAREERAANPNSQFWEDLWTCESHPAERT